jgi:hypothetical protein
MTGFKITSLDKTKTNQDTIFKPQTDLDNKGERPKPIEDEHPEF